MPKVPCDLPMSNRRGKQLLEEGSVSQWGALFCMVKWEVLFCRRCCHSSPAEKRLVLGVDSGSWHVPC